MATNRKKKNGVDNSSAPIEKYSDEDIAIKVKNHNNATQKLIGDALQYSANKKQNIARINADQERNSKINGYLDTSHRMTNEEKNDATNMVNDYFDSNPIAKKSFQMQTSNPYRARKFREENMSARERAEFDKMSALNAKGNKYTEDITSFFQGAYNKLPFLSKVANKYDETFGYKGNLSSKSAKENAFTQSPIANIGGQAATTALEYMMANKALEGAKFLDVPLNTPYSSKLASSVLRGQIADTAIDTLPMLYDDIKEGKSAKEIGKDLAINQGVNLAMNTLGGALDAKAYAKQYEMARNAQARDLAEYADQFNLTKLLEDTTPVSRVREAERSMNDYVDDWNNLNALASSDVVKNVDNTPSPQETLENLMKVSDEATPFSKKEAREINKALDNSGVPFADDINARQNRIAELRREQDGLQNLSETPQARARFEEIEDEIFALEDEIAEMSGRNFATESRNYTSLPSLDASKSEALDTAIHNVRNPIPSFTPEYRYVGEQAPEREIVSLLPEGYDNPDGFVSNDLIDPRFFEWEKSHPSGISADEYDDQLADAFSGVSKEFPSGAKATTNVPSLDSNGVVKDPYTSRHYETMKKSQMFQSAENQAALETAKEAGAFAKTVENRKTSMETAAREFASDPTKVVDEVLNGDWVNGGLDIDKSALVLNDALQNGNTSMVNRVARQEAMHLTNAGRELRAVQDNYVATAEGTIVNGTQYMMKEAEKFLNKGGKVAEEMVAMAEDAVKSGDATKIASRFSMNDADFKAVQEALGSGAGTDEIARMIAMHNRLGITQISDETISSIKQIYDRIEELGLGINSKERADLEADAYKILAKEIGGSSSFKQKWDAWRYLAMLGNPKTHLRNVLGNTTQYMVTEVKDNIAGALEGVIDKANRAFGGNGIARQKSILNRLSETDNALVKLARSDADNEAYRMLNDMGSKYNEVKGAVERSRDAFDSKFMNFLNDKNGNLLEGEDYFGLKNKYSKALARYLKANGADAEIFKATDDTSKELLQKAREYAVTEAKRATFHEYSVLAEKLSNMSQNLRYGDNANAYSKAAGAVIESLVPFKKTPINVLKQGVKYSPVSIAKAIFADAPKVAKGVMTASDMIEDLAAGMTGTGILVLGAFLTNQGLLAGKGSDEYDVNTAEKRQGKQEYALTFGDKSYTIDWLAPFSLPLFVGAELYNQFNNEEYQNDNALDKFISALQTIGEPVTEMSMLQGINDSLEQLSYSKESALGTFVGNAASGYITQGVPTVFGQIARSVDDTRRSTYSDQESGFKKQAQRSFFKAFNKIPGLSTQNEEYRNEWGETEENTGGSVLGRLAYNMFSPGYYADSSKMTDADRELQRLYDNTGESAYSDTLSGSIDGYGKLSRQDFTRYQEQYGKTNKEIVDSFMANSSYARLDDSEKVEIINKAYKISKAIADNEFGGKDISKTNAKPYAAYKKDGVKGLTDYLLDAHYAKIEKDAKSAENAQRSDEALNYGFVKKDGKGNYDAYEKAKAVYGNDTKGLSLYGNATANMQRTTGKQFSDGFKYSIPYLYADTSMSDEQKGMSLIASKGGVDALSEKAKKSFESEGYSGVYYYYLNENIMKLDKNKNGVISEEEWLKNYDQSKLSNEFLAYLSQFYDMRY